MSEILTVDDIRRSSWREDLEERQTRERERHRREIDAERERKVRVAAEKQQAVAANWYAAVDGRIHEHLKGWLWKAIDEHITQWWNDNAIDERIAQSWDIKCEPFKDAIGGALGKTRERLRGEFKQALGETVDAFGAQIAALEQRLVSNNQAALASRIEVALAHERDEAQTKLAALEERLRAVPGRLPAVKTYCPDTVHYAGHIVAHRGRIRRCAIRRAHRRMSMIGFASPVPGAMARVSQCVVHLLHIKNTCGLMSLSTTAAALSQPVTIQESLGMTAGNC